MTESEKKRLLELSKLKYSELSNLEMAELQKLGRKRAKMLENYDPYEDYEATCSIKPTELNSYMYGKDVA